MSDVPAAISTDMSVENALINEIGRLIVTDSEYAEPKWQLAAIVYDFVDGQTSSYGYVYYADAKWKAALPNDSFDDLYKMLELQAAMERRTGKKWLRALVHIDRVKQDINFTFEYDDPTRWQIRPNDLEASVNALRPENN